VAALFYYLAGEPSNFAVTIRCYIQGNYDSGGENPGAAMNKPLIAVLFTCIVLRGCATGEGTSIGEPVMETRSPVPKEVVSDVEPTLAEASSDSDMYSFPSAPTPEVSINYVLKKPSTKILVSLINQEAERFYNLFYNFSDEWLETVIFHEVYSIDDFISVDIDLYYPDGLPEWEGFVTDSIMEWRGLWLNPLKESAYRFIDKGFQKYLVNNPPTTKHKADFSTSSFQATVYMIDDPDHLETTLLIVVRFVDYDFTSFYGVTVESSGDLVILPDILPKIPRTTSATVNVNTDHDLNRDGQKDILLEVQTYFAGGVSGTIELILWNDGDPVFLDSASLPSVTTSYGEAGESTYEIGDFNNDGWDEILVKYPRFYPFGCYWETEIMTSWIGTQKMEDWRGEAIPDTHDCDLAQVILADSLEDRIPWLEKFVASSEYEAGSTDLKAWVQLQLAISYAAQGNGVEAEVILASLYREEGDDPFLLAIHEAHEQAGPSPLAVCQALYQKAQEIGGEAGTFGSDIDRYLSPEVYPISWEPYPPRVCPYWDLLRSDLGFRLLPYDSDVDKVLSERDFPVIAQTNLNIDADADLELIAVLDVGQPLLAVIDSGDDGIRIYPIDYLFHTPVSIQSNTFDANEDGILDILIVADLGIVESLYNDSFCLPNSEDYYLLLVTIDGEHDYKSKSRVLACYPYSPFDLQTDGGMKEFVASMRDVESCDYCGTEYFQDTEEEILPKWISLEGFLEEPRNDAVAFNYYHELRNRVIDEQDRSPVREEIQALIDFLPSDEPAVVVLLPELIFYIGLSYELDGNEAKALDTYLDLIQEYPESPWSWLAWSRIEPSPLE
jgi:hypothetical protein